MTSPKPGSLEIIRYINKVLVTYTSKAMYLPDGVDNNGNT